MRKINTTYTTDAAAKRKSFEEEHGTRFLQRNRKTNSVQNLLKDEEIRTAEEEVRNFLRELSNKVLLEAIRSNCLIAAAVTVDVYVWKCIETVYYRAHAAAVDVPTTNCTFCCYCC